VATRLESRRVYETCGYLLDPHSAIGYLAVTRAAETSESTRIVLRQRNHPPKGGSALTDIASPPRIFLATAHPAKFREIVEPIIGRPLDIPAPLASAIAKPRRVLRMEPSIPAVRARILDQ
jgi:threonine synthase